MVFAGALVIFVVSVWRGIENHTEGHDSAHVHSAVLTEHSGHQVAHDTAGLVYPFQIPECDLGRKRA